MTYFIEQPHERMSGPNVLQILPLNVLGEKLVKIVQSPAQ